MIVRRTDVLPGVRFELRLATSAAEQDFLAVVRRSMRRIGLGRHAANRIALRLITGMRGMMIMGRVCVHGVLRGEPRS
jgi:hypothetical protein